MRQASAPDRFVSGRADGRPGGQLLQILQLRAAVALTKWVDIVDITHDRPRRFGEGVTAQSTQEVGLNQSAMDVRHAGFDKLAKLELAPALGDLDRAKLARPGVHILEQMPMDGPKVVDVETAGRDTLGGPLCHQFAFNMVQPISVLDAEPVYQDG